MTIVPTGMDLGNGVEVENGAAAKVARPSKLAYERLENRADQAGTSTAPASRSVIRTAIRELSKPLDVGTDPVLAQKRIEEERL